MPGSESSVLKLQQKNFKLSVLILGEGIKGEEGHRIKLEIISKPSLKGKNFHQFANF